MDVIKKLESYVRDMDDRIAQNTETIYRKEIVVNNLSNINYSDSDTASFIKMLKSQILNYQTENELLFKYRNMVKSDIISLKEFRFKGGK